MCTGDEIPGIGFGTWTTGNGQQATDQVEQAIGIGFDHVGASFMAKMPSLSSKRTTRFTFLCSDTAQSYRNETEAGQALRESGIPRSEVFITTKFSGMKDVETSINDSLKNVSSFK